MLEETSLDAAASRSLRRKLPAILAQVTSIQTCRKCGRGSHSRQTCPAQDATCFCCNRKGHYSSQCLSTTAAEPKQNLSELTTYAENDANPETSTRYLDAVAGTRKESWIITIEVDSHPVSVNVDTGAEVTTLSETT